MKKQKKELKLTSQELQLLINVLYQNRWNGQEWQKTIMPLINKMSKMIDGLTNKEKFGKK